MNNFEKFYTMTPMKYYQPLDYKNQKAIDMLSNKDGNYIATRKNDGEWCRLIIDADGNIKAQSRSISKVTGQYGDKTELIPHITQEFLSFPRETVLIGELCFADITKTSRDVGAILRCKADKAIQRQKNEKLILKVFDCLAFAGMDLMPCPYWERLANARDAIGDGGNYITMTDIVEFTDFEDFLQEILAEGGEGIVIHKKDALYKPGARTAWESLKVKKIVEELELPIIRFLEPNRSYMGEDADTWKYWMGTYTDSGKTVFIDHAPGNIDKEYNLKWEPVTKPYWMGWKNGIVVDNHGTEVRVASGLTDEDREWLATPEAMQLLREGKLVAVISAMEIVKDSLSLRHPRLLRIRTDV